MIIKEPQPFERGLKLDFYPITTYEQFERIAEILQDEFGAEMVSKLDGPDARLWKMRIDSSNFELNHYSSIGNWIVCREENGRNIIYRIREVLNKLLA
jgi:hypothetical protein